VKYNPPVSRGLNVKQFPWSPKASPGALKFRPLNPGEIVNPLELVTLLWNTPPRMSFTGPT